MATKFGTKSAITRLVQEISLRALRLSWVIEVGLSNDTDTDTELYYTLAAISRIAE